MRRLYLALVLVLLPALGLAQDAEPDTSTPPEAVEGPMTLPRMAQIVEAIDPEARFFGSGFELTLQDVPVIIITDPLADRMRAMVPIRSAAGLDANELLRLMQANFDSALDARYAVANGRLWGVFIHPLSPLKKDQFLSGLAQTVNVARTYGQSYSGGGTIFGGGDSGEIYQGLLEELLEKGEAL
ncbi:MAG: hypothetical protein HRU30_05070 [Rhodobacteraceae bacterium]|nr:hypothetical protein [Paracoccaceae bacterium]